MSERAGSDLRCDRVQLLLSLSIDGRTTEAQETEIAEHLPGCGGCRAARAADGAVRARCAEPAVVPTGFAERVTTVALRQRLEARAQNRFLVAAGVAAVLVAGVSWFGFRPPQTEDGAGAGSVAVRDAAGRALQVGLAIGRTPESGGEDR